MTGVGVTCLLPPPTVTRPTSDTLYRMHWSVLMSAAYAHVTTHKGEGAR